MSELEHWHHPYLLNNTKPIPEHLQNRKAQCCVCGCTETNSNENLPEFLYCPLKEMDAFYCGCMGMD